MGEKIKKALGIKGDFKSTIVPMINYSYSNMFLGGAGYIISMYFTIFLTDVVNLSLNQAGIVVMLATIWDAVTDPVMGIVTDRTRSKYGKHRKYLLMGIPVLLVSYSLLWNSFGLNGAENPKTAMVYYVLIYMLYKTAFTIISVPHTAMLPELAPDYDLRTQYNSVGYLFNSAGMVPSFGIAVLILALLGSNGTLTSASKTPFLIIGIVLAVFYSVSVFLTFKTTKEPSSLQMNNEKLDLKYILREYVLVFKNKSFRQYFFMSVAHQFSTGFYANSKVYYIKYLANQYGKYAIYNAVAGVAEAAAFPLNYELTIKRGKKKCGNIVTPLMVAGLAIGFTLQGFGLVTGDKVAEYEASTGMLFEQSSSAVFGVRICVAIIPIIAAIVSLILLRNFQMTKEDHTMIRAAIAVKHKYGSISLTEEQIKRCELISGQKFEKTWLGTGNADSTHTLETNENGEYIILLSENDTEEK